MFYDVKVFRDGVQVGCTRIQASNDTGAKIMATKWVKMPKGVMSEWYRPGSHATTKEWRRCWDSTGATHWMDVLPIGMLRADLPK